MAANITQEQQQAAYDTLYNEVFVPAFLEKLAANGLEVNTEAEARRYLSMAHKLQTLDAQRKKVAGVDRLARYDNALDELLKQAGVAAPTATAPAEDPINKTAAQAAVTRPDLASAALILAASAA